MTERTRKVVLAAVLALGVALRLVGLEDPIAIRRGAAWREADVGAIARAFHREGMNPLHPRIAWRGDGPGYVESEFPVVPLCVAAAWHVTGESDVVARLVVAAFGIAALFVFAGLARRTLGPPGALAATLLFAVNPLLVFFGTSLQPDPAMLLFGLLAFSALERWSVTGDERAWWRAALWLGLAVLAKASAAHLGLVTAAAALRRHGLGALRRPSVWLGAALAIGPGLLWYTWARGLWTDYGNSLGLSNQDHWIGPDVFTDPKFVVGLLQRELVNVFSFAGVVLAVCAWRRRPRPPVVWLAAVWAGAALAFLVATIRTSAGGWAFYYHAIAVAPAALLAGAGFEALAALRPSARVWRAGQRLGLGTALLGAAAVLVTGGLAQLVAAGVALVAVLGALASYAHRPATAEPAGPGGRDALLPTVSAIALPFLLAAAVGQLTVVALKHAAVRDPDGSLTAARGCARQLAARVPADSLIVATGGAHVDEDGHAVAHDRSIVFYYMDRFGFLFPSDTPDVRAALQARAQRGARWYVVENGVLAANPRLVGDFARAGALVDDCSSFTLVDLGRVFAEGVRRPPAASLLRSIRHSSDISP